MVLDGIQLIVYDVVMRYCMDGVWYLSICVIIIFSLFITAYGFDLEPCMALSADLSPGPNPQAARLGRTRTNSFSRFAHQVIIAAQKATAFSAVTQIGRQGSVNNSRYSSLYLAGIPGMWKLRQLNPVRWYALPLGLWLSARDKTAGQGRWQGTCREGGDLSFLSLYPSTNVSSSGWQFQKIFL